MQTTPLSQKSDQPLRERVWFVVLLLILVFPIGLLLLWIHSRWSQSAKISATAVWGILAMSLVIPSNKSAHLGNPSIPGTAPSPVPTLSMIYADIKPARPEWVAAIRGGINPGVKVSRAGYMVRARNFDNIYFVALQLDVPDQTGRAKVWGVWGVDASDSMIISTGRVSAAFSDYPLSVVFPGYAGSYKAQAGIWASEDEAGRKLKSYVLSQNPLNE